MDQQSEHAFGTGELAGDACPTCGFKYCRCEEMFFANLNAETVPASAVSNRASAMTERDRQFENLLVEADVLTKAKGWRMLLSAHDHVWRDREWPWRVRFDAAGMLWNHALRLCRENMLRRVA